MTRPSGLQFYNVRFVNTANLDEYDRRVILRHLSTYFGEVTKAWHALNPDSQALMIQPTFFPGSLAEHELRCFVLNSQRQSRVQRFSPGGLGQAGTTFRADAGMVSEVYASVLDNDNLCIARAIFHELMHNKLQMGDEMHTDGEVGFGLASRQVECNTDLRHRSEGGTYLNWKSMAKALFKRVPQYQGP
jgi:hypothetical protein